jgi:hypothetical protein
VRLGDVYPGIDQVFHSVRGQLDYDLVVAPGADSSGIRMAFDGVDAMRVDQAGDLVLTAGSRDLAVGARGLPEEW